MRLLVVEDHEILAKAIKMAFERDGYVVDTVLTCEDGRAATDTVSYDAIILDRGLPDDDGLNLLRELRSRGNPTPVILLTARNQLNERVEGLNCGGDDYVAKPVEMEELIARVRALLRRPATSLALILNVGNLDYDTRNREVRVGGTVVEVSRRETDVLEQLLRRAGRVVPKDVLEEKIYGFDEEVSSNSIEVHISRLRKRLADSGAAVEIKTRRGIGYIIGETAAV
ncbi:MAG: response regulator transcription factor [Alphaproteobacteria bacterium]|nr:response regulator transcription factor [Alphaproteobacteria bacterium]